MADHTAKSFADGHHVEELNPQRGVALQDALAQQEQHDAEAIQEKYHIPMKEVLNKHLDQDPKVVKRIMRKVDLRLMPMLSLLYMWAFIDRANLGNVSRQCSQTLSVNSRH